MNQETSNVEAGRLFCSIEWLCLRQSSQTF